MTVMVFGEVEYLIYSVLQGLRINVCTGPSRLQAQVRSALPSGLPN